jgi:hypothetical protein
MRKLIQMIEESGIGIHIIAMIMNVLLYADDVALVSSSTRDMQALLNIVEAYSLEFELKLNPDKSVLLVFNYKNESRPVVKLNGEKIEEAHSTRYLGAYISNDGSNDIQIKERLASSLRSMGKLREIGMYSEYLPPTRKADIYIVMIRSIMLYASECTCYNLNQKAKLKRCESIAVKQAIGIYKYCHHSEIFSALKIDDLGDRLDISKLSFFIRLLNNTYTNEIVTNVISALPKPRLRYDRKSSVTEEVLNIIGLPYDETIEGYNWDETIVRELCNARINELKQRSEKLKMSRPTELTRQLLSLPHKQMVNQINRIFMAFE